MGETFKPCTAEWMWSSDCHRETIWISTEEISLRPLKKIVTEREEIGNRVL